MWLLKKHSSNLSREKKKPFFTQRKLLSYIKILITVLFIFIYWIFAFLNYTKLYSVIKITSDLTSIIPLSYSKWYMMKQLTLWRGHLSCSLVPQKLHWACRNIFMGFISYPLLCTCPTWALKAQATPGFPCFVSGPSVGQSDNLWDDEIIKIPIGSGSIWHESLR